MEIDALMHREGITFSARGLCTRQNLTSKDDPRTERIRKCIMTVDS